MEIKKMMKTASVLDKVLRVLQAINWAAAVCIVGMVALFVIGSILGWGNPWEIVSLHLTIKYGEIILRPGYLTGRAAWMFGISLTVSAIIAIALLIYVVRTMRHILAPMKEGLPFNSIVSAGFRKIAWLWIFSNVALGILDIVQYRVFTNAYPPELFLNSGIVERVEYDGVFSLGFLLTAAALFLLSYIFSYGQALQQQADETL